VGVAVGGDDSVHEINGLASGRPFAPSAGLFASMNAVPLAERHSL
jgi:hypothetical protein